MKRPSVLASLHTRRLVPLITALVLAVAFVLLSWFLLWERAEALAFAETRAQAGAKLLEEHMRGTIRSVGFVVERVAAQIGRRAPAALAGQAREWEFLQERSAGLPQRGSLWVTDDKGITVLASRAFPSPAHDLSDRPYFRQHRDGGVAEAVGGLVKGRDTGSLAFTVSRRLDDAEGRFQGIVVGAIGVNYFTQFHQNLGFGQNSSSTVMQLSGDLVVRHPQPERFVGGNVRGSPVWTAGMAAEESVIRVLSPLDQVERVVGVRRLSDLGLIVGVGISVDEVLMEWRELTSVSILLFLVTSILAFSLSRVLVARFEREEMLIQQLEEKVRQRTLEAETQAQAALNANQSKTRFLAAASHDLRQPLQAAGMFAEVLAMRLEQSPHMAVVEKLRQSIETTQSLLTTLLDVSALEAGKLDPQISNFPIAPLLLRLFEQSEPEARRKGLDLRLVNSSAHVRSDPVLLERLLRNLVVNALRYTPSGGVLLGVRLGHEHVSIQVIDTGEGIPQDQLDAIFGDFYRLDNQGGNSAKGLGLGLGVVRRTAELLGHDISVQSVRGRGSRFTVRVPRRFPV